MKNAPLSPQSVLDVLQHTPHPMRLDDILRIVTSSRRDKKALLEILHELARDGRLLRLAGGRWGFAGHLRSVTGVLSIQRSGSGFVTPEGATTKGGSDIFIPAANLGVAWHGDTVEVVLLPGARKGRDLSPEGRISTVITRNVTELAARVTRRRTARGLLCRPADPRFNFDLDVDVSTLDKGVDVSTLAKGVDGAVSNKGAAGSIKEGELLMVAPTVQRGPTLWEATAIQSMGLEDSVDVQERLVRLNHGIPEEFPFNVQTEADGLKASGEKLVCVPETHGTASTESGGERRDVRHLPLVTIDGLDARDFDDAVCVERLLNGGRVLWVAIADVSHYVRNRSALDKEARQRGTSCYFPRSVSPMLPEALSNDLCSLRPDEDRPVMVARMEFSDAGLPGATAFFPGLMRSRARLDYEGVQALLDGKTENVAVKDMLTEAAILAQQLMDSRTRRGGLDFDLPEACFDFDADGRVTGVHARERLFSHRLIEAFMLAANEAVAAFLTRKNMPFPLRVHPAPDSDRLRNLFRMLGLAGLEVPRVPSAAQLPALLESARNSPQAALAGRLLLRSMMQARYAPGPADPESKDASGHFGLASLAYCHFTSPIRRYPDLLVHRALKLALKADDSEAAPAGQKLLALCDQCNETERAAQEAEREITRRMACLALEGRIDELFEGVVAGVNAFGLFVEPTGLPVEGLVRVDTLPEDWYEFDQDRQELIGQTRGLRFRLGQPLKVRLANVNVGRLEVDFQLADVPNLLEDAARSRRSPRFDRKVDGKTSRKTGGKPSGGPSGRPSGKHGDHGNSRASQTSRTSRTSRSQGRGK